MRILMFMIAVYRANPFRPHCRPGHHVRLCRLIIPRIEHVATCGDSTRPPLPLMELCPNTHPGERAGLCGDSYKYPYP